jgi:hypothetical protein
MKWYFLSVCILGSLIVIWKMSDKETAIAVQQAPSVSLASATTNEQELRLENRRLREQIAQLTDEITKLKHITNKNNFSQHSVEISHQAAVTKALAEQADAQVQIQEFNNSFTNGRDPIAALKTNFASEEVDNSWASTNQHQLETFFKESFTDLLPQYIECRSTRCRITVPVADQKKISALSETLMQGIFQNEKGIAKKIVIEPSTNDGTLNFYLARNDEVNLFK